MKTFSTAVSLTKEEAKELIETIYSTHYTCDGNIESISTDKLKKLSDELFLLLTLPIGSEVVMSEHRGTKPGVAWFTNIHFKHEFRVVKITVYRQETSTPIDIASFFLNAKDIWDFNYSIRRKWMSIFYKPTIVDPIEKEIAQAKWGYYA